MSLVGALLVGSFFVLGTVTLPANNLTYSSVQNFGHFVLFAFLGFAVLRSFLGLLHPRWFSALILSTICLAVFGLAIELFQKNMADRTASVGDLVLDVAGIVAGSLVVWIISLFRAGDRWRLSLALLGLLAITLLSARSMIGLIGFDVFRSSLPIVRDFHHPFSTSKVETYGGAEFTWVKGERSGEDPHTALRVWFTPRDYSGVIFHESGAKWSDYENLSINIFSALPTSRQIELRINDTLHNNRYSDRYNGSFSISPGKNELRIPLISIVAMGENTESQREMDVDDISRIQFFVRNIDEPFALDFVKIELL